MPVDYQAPVARLSAIGISNNNNIYIGEMKPFAIYSVHCLATLRVLYAASMEVLAVNWNCFLEKEIARRHLSFQRTVARLIHSQRIR